MTVPDARAQVEECQRNYDALPDTATDEQFEEANQLLREAKKRLDFALHREGKRHKRLLNEQRAAELQRRRGRGVKRTAAVKKTHSKIGEFQNEIIERGAKLLGEIQRLPRKSRRSPNRRTHTAPGNGWSTRCANWCRRSSARGVISRREFGAGPAGASAAME